MNNKNYPLNLSLNPNPQTKTPNDKQQESIVNSLKQKSNNLQPLESQQTIGFSCIHANTKAIQKEKKEKTKNITKNDER